MVALTKRAQDTATMKAILITALVSVLLGCQKREPVISDAEYAAFKEANPGMLQTCLDDVRYGGLLAQSHDNPECYEMLPAQQWTGLWQHGWEWSNFCPDPCDWTAERGTWLEFADDADREPDLRDGIHRIVFIGRRTKNAGNFGHLGDYQHLMVVDRLLAIGPREKER